MYFCPNDCCRQLSRYYVVVFSVVIFVQMATASCSPGTTLFILVQKGLQFPVGKNKFVGQKTWYLAKNKLCEKKKFKFYLNRSCHLGNKHTFRNATRCAWTGCRLDDDNVVPGLGYCRLLRRSCSLFLSKWQWQIPGATLKSGNVFV